MLRPISQLNPLPSLEPKYYQPVINPTQPNILVVSDNPTPIELCPNYQSELYFPTIKIGPDKQTVAKVVTKLFGLRSG